MKTLKSQRVHRQQTMTLLQKPCAQTLNLTRRQRNCSINGPPNCKYSCKIRWFYIMSVIFPGGLENPL